MSIRNKEIRLRSDKSHRVVMFSNTNIWFHTPEGEHFTSAVELAYIIQEWQKEFGKIPVKVNPPDFKGITSEDQR